MKTRLKLVWKLTAMVIVILAMAIGLAGYIHIRLWDHYSLASTQTLLRFNSEALVEGIRTQMMNRNKAGVEKLIREIARDGTVCRDIRLVAHHSGRVVTSRSGDGAGTLTLEDWGCAVCHDRNDRGGETATTHDVILDRPDGSRVLSVMAPVLNERGCTTADCHAHADDPSILGFVNADYSLQPMDTTVAHHKTRTVIGVVASLLLAMVALSFLFGQMLEKPIRGLIEGTKQIAARHLDFRFDRNRHDEIGILQESFNKMTATIQASHAELHEAKEYLEGLIEHSADIIITVNAEGLIETFNRGAEEALGYGREEVIGRPIEDLYVEPSDRADAATRLETTRSVNNFETRLRDKDGRIHSVLLTLSRLRDSDGKSIGTIGISKDISQERRLQDELRDAKEYLEAMVENSADIIITVNPNGLIQTFNHGGETALGYRREEVIGRHIESLFVDPRERAAAIARLEDQNNVRNYETHFRTKDGQIRNVLLTLSRLRDSEGRAFGTLGISKDITQERSLQRELIQSQKLAAIGQAVTGIQHAIKNMLNSLKGGSYMVRTGMAKDNREWIEDGWAMVEEGIERIGGLTRNLLNFARDWKPDLQNVDLGALVANVCDLNRQTAEERGVALRDKASDALPPVRCDPKLVHMAVTDIVVNAIDACTEKEYHPDESPEVVLDYYLDPGGDVAVIRVRDNGCGMNDTIRENIFTPFFSTKSTLGTGLGLAMTARIIRVHEGDISVASQPDHGSTFLIHLPTKGPRD